MPSDSLRIVGARQHNLRGVDVDIPRHRLVAITGVSGSGKSSLAFDTLFREGQRRFLETLSAYARQFLGRMEKPDVDRVEGLSPAIAVDQKAASTSPRSTVGTLTEVFDHLRVLFARAGTAHCAACDLPLRSQTAESILQQALVEFAGRQVSVLAPLVRDRKGEHRELLEDLARRGFVRARVDGAIVRVEEAPALARYKRHTIEAVVDRLRPDPAQPSRLREAVESALELAHGEILVAATGGGAERSWSTSRACPRCGAEAPPLEPRLFSFNSPHGSCPECGGLGVIRRASEARVVRDRRLSIRDGALAVTRKSGGALTHPNVDFRFLERVARAHGFDLDTPWRDLPRTAQRVVLHGAGDERYEDTFTWNGAKFQGSARWNRRFRGVLPAIERALASGRPHLARFVSTTRCPACAGTRLRPEALAVRVGGATLRELLPLPVGELAARLGALTLPRREARIARDLRGEIDRRLGFLSRVGLEYLSLDRGADTLSGGEAQRIRLAAQLGSALQGVLYVLDEPSIGLHARDHAKLLGALQALRDGGNTIVVVEHVEATLRAADHLIDVGPGAGRDGGRIVAQGTPEEVARADSPTARFLRGELAMPAPAARRRGNGRALAVRGARAFNLKSIDVEIPLGTLTAVSGVSGSGKSTLIDRVLAPAVLAHLDREGPEPGEHDEIDGLAHVGDIVSIDAAPIGRTPRSNPATYTDAFGPIRDLFASLPEARLRGYSKSRFSFNVEGGRCEACGGGGANLVELQFLAPVTVECEECGGKRFQAETLDVRYKERSIADVLGLTVDEALELFADHPKIVQPLATMAEIGLGYLTLGQPSTTLSGGEAQRIKLVSHLKKRARAHTLYLLDEPTVGLHPQDVAKLVGALQRLVDAGHTVIVVEHNLDVIRAADWVIDLGPDGGERGGEVVASGTPEAIAACGRSATGAALRGEFVGRPRAPGGEPHVRASDSIHVVGAKTHNLKDVEVALPRDSLVVVTGPSGSGKSSLALDTIYSEGRRRFVESLTTYARQFLGNRDRPPVDRIEGLGPAVAVEAGTSRGHPRSTVATTTEIHDHLRVLFSRAGEARCPSHGRPLERRDPSQIARAALKALAGRKALVVAPLGAHDGTGGGDALRRALDELRREGFLRARVDGAEVRLDRELPALAPDARVDVVIDRLALDAGERARVAEAAEQASQVSGGRVAVIAAGGERLDFSTQGACPECGFTLAQPLEPRHFSFNTHAGACPECDGLGVASRCDPELLIERPELPLYDGAIHAKLGRYLIKGKGYYEHLLRRVAEVHGVDLDLPFERLAQRHRELVLHGTGARATYEVVMERSTSNADVEERFTAPWPGLCGHVDAWHAKAEDPEWAAILESVMHTVRCDACRGERLRPEARAVTLASARLPQVLAFGVATARRWVETLASSKRATDAVAPVIAELRSRLALLERVGLGYLTLDRPTHTLSGGEARRVRLSASLGSQLVGVCYVLDEPTVGLHPADVARLTDALRELALRGNSVIVVEHDESLMRAADCIVDLGPGAGAAGGRVVALGTPDEVAAVEDSPTGRALRGEYSLAELRDEPVDASAERARIALRGARGNNLTGVDLELALGAITGVCGPSGSGKSTLALDTLVPALRGERPEGRWKGLAVPRGGVRVVVIDASPLGRTPASTPATYTGLMEPLRECYARTPDARARGLTPSHFSFNSPRGRCEACEGKGATLVEMQFLADLWLTCDECGGKRFAPGVLEARYRGKSIADVLDLTVDEALEFLAAHPRAVEILATLRDVGLGYLALSQSSTTLSGGEAQRVKLASELHGAEGSSASVLVLDEPSTGLHASDVAQLARVLRRLAQRGHAVLLIEHHTGLLSICDTLLELGPGGGEAGGRVIARGTPRDLARDPASVTGPFLARELERRPLAARGVARAAGARDARKVREVAR